MVHSMFERVEFMSFTMLDNEDSASRIISGMPINGRERLTNARSS